MTSDSSHEFGITIGGEKGFDLTNEHSYDIDVLSVEEFHLINDGVHTGTEDRSRTDSAGWPRLLANR